MRRLDLRSFRSAGGPEEFRREWLATNGLGGYASATVSGAVAWRYHGLLIAALPSPLGRVVMLNQLWESILYRDGESALTGELHAEEEAEPSCPYLVEFKVENGLPTWRWELGDLVLEKSVLFPYGQNTVHVQYAVTGEGDPLRLRLRPGIDFREHELPVQESRGAKYQVCAVGQRFEILGVPIYPSLRMMVRGQPTDFLYSGGVLREVYYRKEAERGFPSLGSLWCPGAFEIALAPGQSATLIASTESWQTIEALNPAQALRFHLERHQRLVRQSAFGAQDEVGADLVLAADQFIVTPAGRVQDAARAHAAGDEIRTVVAGYPWFTDWGRDTMISLEGLTLTTNRTHEAGWILRTFAFSMKDGLIPNLYPEGENEGLYHTADATLWFFHALDRYLDRTGDTNTLRLLLPKLKESMNQHREGTHFGIVMDPADGLLRQGAEGYQLTWMDAKVEGWVVTPRRGKAVEINGLWYHALRLMEKWMRSEEGDTAASEYGDLAARVRDSFNQRFWHASAGHLYDVVDGEKGDDPACRPNQLLAFSLPNAVLSEGHWEPVLKVVAERMLTPVGLRTLSREHSDYKAKYFGDLRARDAAYHQGTVWAWLIGPFIDAWLKVYPDDTRGAREFLRGFVSHLEEGCVGSVSEIFDAEPPFFPRGCVAQAWSVAEVLRCWVKTAAPGAGKILSGDAPGTARESDNATADS